MPAEGPPDAALFARLVREPGAVRQFSRDVLRGDLARSLAREMAAGE